MAETITLSKQVFAKSQYERVIDTTFTQLVQPQVTSSVVPPIKTSQEYVGNFNNDETIQALIEEITQLRQENLTLQQQLLTGSLTI